MALRTPTKGSALGTYIRSIRESQKVKDLRSKLSLRPVDVQNVNMRGCNPCPRCHQLGSRRICAADSAAKKACGVLLFTLPLAGCPSTTPANNPTDVAEHCPKRCLR